MRLIKENTDDVVEVTDSGVEVGVTVTERSLDEILSRLFIYEALIDGCTVGMPG